MTRVNDHVNLLAMMLSHRQNREWMRLSEVFQQIQLMNLYKNPKPSDFQLENSHQK